MNLEMQITIIGAAAGLVTSILTIIISNRLKRPLEKAQANNLKANTIKQLNEVTSKQADRIERLKNRVDVLEDQVEGHQIKIESCEAMNQLLNDEVGKLQQIIAWAKDIIHKLLAILKRENIQHNVEIPLELRKESES